jgi:hypothetical protein
MQDGGAARQAACAARVAGDGGLRSRRPPAQAQALKRITGLPVRHAQRRRRRTLLRAVSP